MRALREEALALGAFRAELVKVEDISTDASFRSLCASNACGNYGKIICVRRISAASRS